MVPLVIKSGKTPSYGTILPVRPRNYETEPYENHPANYPGEANKSAHPVDDEEKEL